MSFSIKTRTTPFPIFSAVILSCFFLLSACGESLKDTSAIENQLRDRSREVSEEIEKSVSIVESGELSSVVSDIVIKINRSIPDNERFRLLRPEIISSTKPEVLVLPNGEIYVSDGLALIAKNEDGLAAIIAHHVGHVLSNHHVSRFRDANTKLTPSDALKNSEIVVLLDSFGINMTSSASQYTISQEIEAEAVAIKLLEDSGFDPREYSRVMDRMSSLIGGGDSAWPVAHVLVDYFTDEHKKRLEAGYLVWRDAFIAENTPAPSSFAPMSYSYDGAKASGGEFLGTSSEALPLCPTVDGVAIAVGSIFMFASRAEMDDGKVYDKEDHRGMLNLGECVDAPNSDGADNGVVLFKVLEEKKKYPQNKVLAEVGYWKLQGRDGNVLYAPRLHDLLKGTKLANAYSVVDFSQSSGESASISRPTTQCPQFGTLNFQTGAMIENVTSLNVSGPRNVSVNVSSNNSASISTSGGCLGGRYQYVLNVNTGFQQKGRKSYSGSFRRSDEGEHCDVYVNDNYANATCN